MSQNPKLRKYKIPACLESVITQPAYESWLRGGAMAHVKRDKKRGNKNATIEAYKSAIHVAVIRSCGRDHYTGEQLDWTLIGRYRNLESQTHGRHYKAGFALLPSIDHVHDGLGEADFRICAWRTNDAKNDLTHADFVELCRLVVRHYDRIPNGADGALPDDVTAQTREGASSGSTARAPMKRSPRRVTSVDCG